MTDQLDNLPNHIAIIPDGNRRWATQKNKKPWDGHEEGAQRIEELTKIAQKKGIKHLSFWGSSADNMTKRSQQEKRHLLNIYQRYFDRLIREGVCEENKVRLNVFGQWREMFPRELVRVLEDGIEQTKSFEKRTLNFFLAYNGDVEMVTAVQSIVRSFVHNAEDITHDTIKKYLYTKNLPPVDYLIRTGGEPHLSAGFMMWDIANAQLYFSEKLFPDFNEVAFCDALDEYTQRMRRMGA